MQNLRVILHVYFGFSAMTPKKIDSDKGSSSATELATELSIFFGLLYPDFKPSTRYNSGALSTTAWITVTLLRWETSNQMVCVIQKEEKWPIGEKDLS